MKMQRLSSLTFLCIALTLSLAPALARAQSDFQATGSAIAPEPADPAIAATAGR